jgi:hypothetical protein
VVDGALDVPAEGGSGFPDEAPDGVAFSVPTDSAVLTDQVRNWKQLKKTYKKKVELLSFLCHALELFYSFYILFGFVRNWGRPDTPVMLLPEIREPRTESITGRWGAGLDERVLN